jgi:hypothetical protein
VKGQAQLFLLKMKASSLHYDFCACYDAYDDYDDRDGCDESVHCDFRVNSDP